MLMSAGAVTVSGAARAGSANTIAATAAAPSDNRTRRVRMVLLLSARDPAIAVDGRQLIVNATPGSRACKGSDNRR
jgi:hypothetical protein